MIEIVKMVTSTDMAKMTVGQDESPVHMEIILRVLMFQLMWKHSLIRREVTLHMSEEVLRTTTPLFS